MQLDMVTGDDVTVAARAPGARYPECGASPDNQRLIRPGNDVQGKPGRRWGQTSAVVARRSFLGLRWYCVETHARCEVMVEDELLARGFDALAPQFMDLLPACPRRKLAEREVLRPAFPGFVLTQFDQALPKWRRIASVRGVRRVMGFSAEQPSPVAEAQVAWIVSQFGFGGVQRRTRLELPPDEPIAVGAVVRVAGGPMEGKRGVVLWSNGRRVKVRLDGWPVEMAQAAVEVIGAEADRPRGV